MAAKIKINKILPNLEADSLQSSHDGNTTQSASGATKQEFDQQFTSKLNKIAKDIKQLRDAASNIRQKSQDQALEIREELEKKITRSTEALGVFVALFTFVSVTIQVFQRVESAATAGAIIFLIFIALASFVILLNLFLVRSPETLWEFLVSYQFWLLAFLFGFAVITICILQERRIAFQPIPESGSFRDAIENMIDKKKGDAEQKALDEFKTCVRQKGLATCVR